MRVIGTAGHVDHGKSTLVQAMTGTHPDRLIEEQEREMTIDLGFAWLKLPEDLALPDAREIGIVDVPGHRDFIENMLAGIGGIDAALFVVAADEGVMPQTREHLAILDLLMIDGGVVALTKVDMVEDPEWLDLVEEELNQVIAGTVLQDAPIVRVSGRTGEGLDLLIEALVVCLKDRPPRPNYGRPRLPVDRVFTMAGFGTVVTGTLSEGEFQVGDAVEILPSRRPGRIRGLQSHNRQLEKISPGGRTAVNISGVNLEDISRGNIIAHPGDYEPSGRLDVKFRLLPDVGLTIKHNVDVKLFLGAAEIQARLRLLGSDVLQPGQEGWLQLELREPVVAIRGDRYILRRPSPGTTLGGGSVVDPQPVGRHKRFSKDVIENLETLSQGTPEDVLIQAAQSLGLSPLKEVCRLANLSDSELEHALAAVFDQGALMVLEKREPGPDSEVLVATPVSWQTLQGQITAEIASYHQTYPLRLGMPKEELRSRLKLSPRKSGVALDYLVDSGMIVDVGPLISLPDHQITFSEKEKAKMDSLLARFQANPYAPPSVKECVQAVGEEVFTAMVQMAALVQVSPEVVFRKQDYEQMVAEVMALIDKSGSITVAMVRDRFQTSRRYVLALLEHLDELGLTVREGDVRKKKP